MTDEALKSMKNALVSAGIPKVYIGELPELQLTCVAVKPVSGYPNTQYFGQKDILEPLVEVLVRSKDFKEGSTASMLAMSTLNEFVDESVGILDTQVTGSPGYLGRSSAGFCEWHMVFHVTLLKY